MRTVIATSAGLLALGNAVDVEADVDTGVEFTYSGNAEDCTAGTALSMAYLVTAAVCLPGNTNDNGPGYETCGLDVSGLNANCVNVEKGLTTEPTSLVAVRNTAFDDDNPIFISSTFGNTYCTGTVTGVTAYRVYDSSAVCIKDTVDSAKFYKFTRSSSESRKFVIRTTHTDPACTLPGFVTTKFEGLVGSAICDAGKLLTLKADASTTYDLKERLNSKAKFTYPSTVVGTTCTATEALRMSLTVQPCTPMTAAAKLNDETACINSSKDVCTDLTGYASVRDAEFDNSFIFIDSTHSASDCASATLTGIDAFVADGTCINTGASTSATYVINSAKTIVTRKTYAALNCAGTATVTEFKTFAFDATDMCETGNKLLTFKSSTGTYKLKTLKTASTVVYGYNDLLCPTSKTQSMKVTTREPEAVCTTGCAAVSTFSEKTVCDVTVANYATARDVQFGDRPIFITTHYVASGSCATIDSIDVFAADHTCIKTGASTSATYKISADGKTVTGNTYAGVACAGNATPITAITIGDTCTSDKKYSIQLQSTRPPTGGAQIAASTPASALLAVFSLAMAL